MKRGSGGILRLDGVPYHEGLAKGTVLSHVASGLRIRLLDGMLDGVATVRVIRKDGKPNKAWAPWVARFRSDFWIIEAPAGK